jgi:hypothetical protein
MRMGQTGRIGCFQQAREKIVERGSVFSVVADYLGFSTAG